MVFKIYIICDILRYILDVLKVRIIDRNFLHNSRIPKLPPTIDRWKKVTLVTRVSIFSGDPDNLGGLLGYNGKCWRKLGFSSVGSIGSTSSIPCFTSGFRWSWLVLLQNFAFSCSLILMIFHFFIKWKRRFQNREKQVVCCWKD